MSMADYSIAVRLSLVENISKGLLSMGSKFALLSKQADVFQAKIAALKHQISIGAGMIGFGSGIAAPILFAANSAGKLQQQLMFVQKATHASSQEMETFRGIVEKSANAFGFTSIDVAAMSKTLATSLQLPINQISKLVPLFSQYAINQQMFKGTSINESVLQGVQLAHLSGHTDVASIKDDLDLLTQLNYIMPGNISKVLQAEKYAQGTLGNIMGVSQKDTMLLIATLNRFGIEGTRAGSSLLSAISRSIPGVMWSGLLPGKSDESLYKMGLVDERGVPKFFKNGKFDFDTWMTTLSSFVKKERETLPPSQAAAEIMKAFQFSMGTTGTRIASVLSSDTGQKEFEELRKSLESMPKLDEQTKNLQGLFSFQQIRFWMNLKNVFTEFGYSILPDLTKITSTLSDKFAALTDWMRAHQAVVAKFEEGLLAIAGLTIAGGVLTLLKVGISGLLLPLEILSGGFATLGGAPILLTAGALAVLGYGIYKFYTSTNYDWNKPAAAFIKFVDTIGKYIGSLVYDILHPIEAYNKPGNKSLNVKAGQWLGSTIYDIFHPKSGKPFNERLGQWYGSKLYDSNHPVNKDTNDIAYQQKLQKEFKFWGVVPASTNTSDDNNPNPNIVFRNNAPKNNINWNPATQTKQPQKIPPPQQNQPIHVQINMDGRKVAQVVAQQYHQQVTSVPNGSSMFDTNLSPMPSVANSLGVTR